MSALLLTLLACNPYEGTWMLYAEVTKAPDPSEEGLDMVFTADLVAMSDGSYTADFTSFRLTGTIEGDEVNMEYVEGYTYSAPDCDEMTSSATYSLDGTISPTEGFDGTLKVVSLQERKACGGSDSDSSTTEYSMTGVKLSANDDAHAGAQSGGQAMGQPREVN